VILPPPPPSRRAHYDLAFLSFTVRNVAKYSPPAVPPGPGEVDEGGILLRLTGILAGQGPDADLDALVGLSGESELGRDERLLDARLRSGPYGLTLADLLDRPHGVDLGPLTSRVPEVLRTPSGRIELCPDPIAADVPRVLAALRAPRDGLVLVGRRHLRSNNSWLHNVPALVKGKQLCTLLVHPDDAARLGLVDGGTARVASRVGEVEATVEVSADMAAGVVSLPHGWGHDRPGTRLATARAHPGVNVNLLTDDLAVDPLSGTAVLNGVHVRVTSSAVQ
jgi:anaerobic selenocysteine-containing dehydrogenase